MDIEEAGASAPSKRIPTLLASKLERPRSPTENPLPVPDRLISRKELRQMIPVSDQTIWRWERDGLFPRRVRLGKGPKSRVTWRLSSVLAWMCEQEAA